MYCPNCGAQAPETAVFCGKCGAALRASAPVPEQPKQPEQPKRKQRIWILILAAVLVIALGLGAFLALRHFGVIGAKGKYSPEAFVLAVAENEAEELQKRTSGVRLYTLGQEIVDFVNQFRADFDPDETEVQLYRLTVAEQSGAWDDVQAFANPAAYLPIAYAAEKINAYGITAAASYSILSGNGSYASGDLADPDAAWAVVRRSESGAGALTVCAFGEHGAAVVTTLPLFAGVELDLPALEDAETPAALGVRLQVEELDPEDVTVPDLNAMLNRLTPEGPALADPLETAREVAERVAAKAGPAYLQIINAPQEMADYATRAQMFSGGKYLGGVAFSASEEMLSAIAPTINGQLSGAAATAAGSVISAGESYGGSFEGDNLYLLLYADGDDRLLCAVTFRQTDYGSVDVTAAPVFSDVLADSIAQTIDSGALSADLSGEAGALAEMLPWLKNGTVLE